MNDDESTIAAGVASREIDRVAEAPKADAEKPPLCLLDGEFLLDVAAALSFAPPSPGEDPRDAAAEALETLFKWLGGLDGGGRGSPEPYTLAAAAARLAAAVAAESGPEEWERAASKWRGGEGRRAAVFRLLPRSLLLQTAAVLQFGAKKYAPWSWALGKEWTRDASAAARHVVAYLAGEVLDPESGLPHLAHAVTCLMIVHGCQIRGLGRDDRQRLPRRIVAEGVFGG